MHKKDERTGKNFNIVVIGNEATWTAKITKIIEGLIIIVLPAVILADGVPSLPEVAGEPLLTLPHFKLDVAVISLVLAASLLKERSK